MNKLLLGTLKVTIQHLMLLLIDMFQVEITVAKYPNRVLVYGIENDVPIFFDVDGRGSQIYPSG